MSKMKCMCSASWAESIVFEFRELEKETEEKKRKEKVENKIQQREKLNYVIIIKFHFVQCWSSNTFHFFISIPSFWFNSMSCVISTFKSTCCDGWHNVIGVWNEILTLWGEDGGFFFCHLAYWRHFLPSLHYCCFCIKTKRFGFLLVQHVLFCTRTRTGKYTPLFFWFVFAFFLLPLDV